MHFLVWLSLSVALCVGEIFTTGFFLMFFAISAGAVSILSLFIRDPLYQIIAFIVLSILLVIFWRPKLKQSLNIAETPKPSNVATLMGERVLILEAVNRYGGRVKVLHTGEVWTAYLADDLGIDVINTNSEALVSKVDGAKLVIKPAA